MRGRRRSRVAGHALAGGRRESVRAATCSRLAGFLGLISGGIGIPHRRPVEIAHCATILFSDNFQTGCTMNPPSLTLTITSPLVSSDAAIWFSAYGFGWGYCAFSLPAESVCKYLGAADTSRKQLMLAFELGRKRISKAIEQIGIPDTGDRITLSTLDA